MVTLSTDFTNKEQTLVNIHRVSREVFDRLSPAFQVKKELDEHISIGDIIIGPITITLFYTEK